MVLTALSIGFSYGDLADMTIADLCIYSAIKVESMERASRGGGKTYREANQADIEALKRM